MQFVIQNQGACGAELWPHWESPKHHPAPQGFRIVEQCILYAWDAWEVQGKLKNWLIQQVCENDLGKAQAYQKQHDFHNGRLL